MLTLRAWLLVFSVAVGGARALAETKAPLWVFGPGGPAPAMKEIADIFSKKTGIPVEVTSGPTSQWKSEALKKAQLIYSGSENMMDSFISEKLVDLKSVETLYLRASALLVRPGNPHKISGFRDLVQKKVSVIVVNGAGQVGMWEDIAGRLKSVDILNRFRKQIAYSAANTGAAEKFWNEHPEVDAWLVFGIWSRPKSNQSAIVPIEEELTMYRSSGIAKGYGPTHEGTDKFIHFLKGPEAQAVFKKNGWFR